MSMTHPTHAEWLSLSDMKRSREDGGRSVFVLAASANPNGSEIHVRAIEEHAETKYDSANTVKFVVPVTWEAAVYVVSGDDEPVEATLAAANNAVDRCMHDETWVSVCSEWLTLRAVDTWREDRLKFYGDLSSSERTRVCVYERMHVENTLI